MDRNWKTALEYRPSSAEVAGMEERERGRERREAEMRDLGGGSILASKWQNDEKFENLFFSCLSLSSLPLLGKNKLFIRIYRGKWAQC